jgi:hypothetical protein
MIALIAAGVVAFAQPPLQPWAALVGHCWTGPAPGSSATDKHCFETVYGGQHIRDTHRVTADGKEVYAGESIYSARGDIIVFTYWNSLGGLGTGQAIVDASVWKFTGTIHATAASADEPIAATWKLTPDGYEVSGGSGPPRLFKRAD